MPTILITGASSGIGLAFLTHYASNPSNKLITADIQPLPTLPKTSTHSTPSHYILDIRSETSIQTFATSLATTPIDLVIHSIGIRGLVDHLHTPTPGSAQNAETLEAMDMATLMLTFQTNTAGTFCLLRALLPSLLLSQQRNNTPPKVVVMSSRMGSVGGNTAGSAYAYRASKAALNAVVRSFAADVRGVTWVLCHPGRVESALVRYKEEGAITGAESVEGLVGIIEGWGEKDSGGFFDRFGEVIPW